MKVVSPSWSAILYFMLLFLWSFDAGAKEYEVKSQVRFQEDRANCTISVRPRTDVASVDIILPKKVGPQRLYASTDGDLTFPLKSPDSFDVLVLITLDSGDKQLVEQRVKVERPIRIRNDSQRKSRSKWEWWVWVDADKETLDSIRYVEYTLHPTFPNPVRRSSTRSTKFELRTSGWGEFRIKVLIVFKDGKRLNTSHDLRLN